MTIDLDLSRNLFVDKFFPYLTDYSHRWEMYMGGAGSSKSYFITQKCIIRACMEKIRILACRRYQTTLRNSVFSLFLEILGKWKIKQYCSINNTEMRITFPNGSEIICIGLDSEEKLLSIVDIGTIFVDEVYECTRDIVEQLDLRLRGHNDNQQILMAWNPISKNHWLYDFVQNPPKSSLYTVSTYKDNPFLPQAYVNSLEELQFRNPKKWEVFGLSHWGQSTDGLVFSNWHTAMLDEMELAKKYEHRVGSDLGFIDPSTIISSYYDERNKTIYIPREYYKTGQTLDNMLQAINNMGLSKSTIFFDSAEPRTIDFFKRNGIRAKPCIKGQNSVSARIAFLQNHTLVVDERCSNLINELENFSYEWDKKTNTYKDNEYTHQWSHAIDGLGYAYSDLYTKTKIRTIDKSVLGI